MRLIRRGQRLFEQTGGGQVIEEAVEHSGQAPAHEAVVQHLVRSIDLRRIPPYQAVPDDINNTADDPPINYP